MSLVIPNELFGVAISFDKQEFPKGRS